MFFLTPQNLGSVDIGLMQINNKFQACAACDMEPRFACFFVFCFVDDQIRDINIAVFFLQPKLVRCLLLGAR